MAGRKGSLTIRLTPEQRHALGALQTQTQTDGTWNRARRATIILAIAAGTPLLQIARDMATSRTVVYRWGWRFAKSGLAGLEDGG